ncbi:MAG: hypothetical protein KDA80_10175 [Planctomycetaceae bacterium]|nr:hypothetical protein [Planctomycetaceae bacterium]
MPRLRVRVFQILISENGDNLGATWKFRVYVNGEEKQWNPGNVEDTSTHSLGMEWELFVADDGVLAIDTGGYEEDAPGFPTFDDHDAIFSINRRHSASDNWGIGASPAAGTGEQSIAYTLYYSVEKLDAEVQILNLKEWGKAYVDQSVKRLEAKIAKKDLYVSEGLLERDKKRVAELKAMSEKQLAEHLIGRVIGQGWSIVSLSDSQIVISRG